MNQSFLHELIKLNPLVDGNFTMFIGIIMINNKYSSHLHYFLDYIKQ